MRKSLLLPLFLVGCTAPTQPWADENARLASQQFYTITDDLALTAKYQALMRALDRIAEASTPEEKKAIVLEMSDVYQDISFLEVESEKAQGRLRAARRWIHAQRGIGNVLMEEWEEARNRADVAKKPTLSTR